MKMLPVLVFFFFAAACNPAKKAERVFGNELFQHWIHSFEDDGAAYRAFRPSDHEFPPARGREGFEIKADGTFIHYPIGPVDVPVEVSGKWRMKDKNTLELTPAEGSSFELGIVEIQKGMLKVKP